MAAQSASLTINVIANAAKAKAGFKDAEKGALSLKGQFEGLKNQMLGKAGMAIGFTAIAAFAAKAASQFTDLAKKAGDLGKATGLTTEEASRWLAVSDDAAVSGEALAAAFKQINKDLDANKWKKYGIATQTAGGQARDANDIFLDTLDTLGALQDPTERARAGTELFGKAWGNVAPLVGKTREQYELMLASVEAGQVITSQEYEQAEKLRLAQDALADAFGEVSLAVGGFVASLAPAITAFATLVGYVAKGVGVLTGTDAKSMTGALKGVSKQFEATKDDMYGTISAFEDLYLAAYNGRSNLSKFADVLNPDSFGTDANKAKAWLTAFNGLLEENPGYARQAALALRTWYDQVKDPVIGDTIRDQATAWGLTEEAINGFVIESESAWLRTDALNAILEEQNDLLDGLISEWEDYLDLLDLDADVQGAKDALVGLAFAFDDPTTAANEFREAQRLAAEEIATFIKNAELMPEDVQLKLLADLQEGNLEEVWKVIDQYMRDHPFPQYTAAPFWVTNARYKGSEIMYGSVPFPKGPTQLEIQAALDAMFPEKANGGPVTGGSTYIVGENGPELFTSNTSGTIIPNGAFAMSGGGGGVQNITINMPAGANGAEVLRALQQEARRTGQLALPVSSKTVR